MRGGDRVQVLWPTVGWSSTRHYLSVTTSECVHHYFSKAQKMRVYCSCRLVPWHNGTPVAAYNLSRSTALSPHASLPVIGTAGLPNNYTPSKRRSTRAGV